MASVRESAGGGNGTDNSGGNIDADGMGRFVNVARHSPLTRDTSVVARAAGGAAGEAHHSTLTTNTSTAAAAAAAGVAAGTDNGDEPSDVDVGDGFVGAAHYRPLTRNTSTGPAAPAPAPAPAAPAAPAAAAAAAAARAAHAAAAARAAHAASAARAAHAASAARTAHAAAAARARHSTLSSNRGTAATTRAAGAANEAHHCALTGNTGIAATREAGAAAAAVVAGAAMAAVGPVGPEKDWQYSAEKLRVELSNIPAENKDIPSMVTAVKEVCLKHGVKLASCGTRREQVPGGGGRLLMCTLKCIHGMPNRQAEHKGNVTDNNKKERKRTMSKRSGCNFRIYVRWPLRSNEFPHPRLTSMELNHQHGVYKESLEVEKMLKVPLSSPMKAVAAQLTGAGLPPATQAVLLKALHHQKSSIRAVEEVASQGSSEGSSAGVCPYDVTELLEKAQACSQGGGVYKVKLDAKGCFSHVFWMTAEQVALATRYGAVLFYDDIAVKKQYCLPIALGVVIDGEYYTRIVFQSITADTTADTFEWMLEAFMEARGAAPDVFIQDADVGMNVAAQKVFPQAKKRRCMLRLEQSVTKTMKRLLGDHFNAFLEQFYRTRDQLTQMGFEAEYTKLVETYPKSKTYMDKLYHERERWAVYCSVLTFGFASFSTSRVASMNTGVRRFCNAKANLMSVFSFFSRGIERQADRAALRDAQLYLPPMSAPELDHYWFGPAVTGPLKYAVGVWPFRFTQEEMGAASLFCSSPENAVLDGPDRVAALGELDYIGNMVLNVETVALIVENRDGTDTRFLVLGMNNGSHLCSCRTLQILGLCCRHFWMAMRLSRRFKFHVGILNQHWLVEQGRKPIGDWPEAVTPKWAVALNHRSLGAEEIVIETPLVAIGGQGGQWESTAEGATIGSSLREIQEKGASAQDRRLLYVDLVKRTTVAVGVGVGTVNPDTLRQLVASFESQVREASRRELAAGRAVRSPDTSDGVRLPPSRSSGKRPRESN